MIKATPSSAPKPPLPPDLNSLVPQCETPWNVSSPLFNRVSSQNSSQSFKLCEIVSSDPEFNFILKYFEYHKPSGYSIKRIVCIHNPDHTQVFEGTLKNMERECNNPVFAPQGKQEEPPAERARVLLRWEAQVAQFSPVKIKSPNRDPDLCVKAKVLPLWHGSSQDVCQSVLSSGFTSFGKHHYFEESAQKGNTKSTDKGYFGSGIYFTNSAHYATMYSSGHLLMAWVAMREPYPVVSDKPHPENKSCSDMKKLGGKEHYQNYNAHYIPVISGEPDNLKCMEYYPCYKDQSPEWDEFVVFEKAQTLPRFWIELSVDFPTVTLSSLSNVGEFLTFILSLLEKEEVKNNQDLLATLQKKVEYLLDLPEATPLGVEDDKLFKLAKRLIPQGEERVNNSAASLFLKVAASNSVVSVLNPSSNPPPSHTQAIPSPQVSLSSREEEYQKGCAYAKTGNPKQAILCYQKAADEGHAEAQYQLTKYYRYKAWNTGEKKDALKNEYETKAEEWCRKAAAQGHGVAQGDCYYYGYGVLKDFNEAAKLFHKNADKGNAEAQYMLGECYSSGKGVSQDFKEGVKWYRRAAEQGNPDAQYMLGVCYSSGQTIAKDEGETVKWYQKAAEQGHVYAQFELANFYEFGKGLYKMPTVALQWYRRAAEQDHIVAQNTLGHIYRFGRDGVPKDLKEAMGWYRKAAEQGLSSAQNALSESWCINLEEDSKPAALPVPPLPAVFSSASAKSALPAIAFGAAEWTKYFGDVGVEPPLPPDIDKILDSSCPFWPRKKVRETHVLVLVPQTVNGKPLNLKLLGELVQKPLQGNATKYSNYSVFGECTESSALKSHWVLMTKDVIQGSRGKSYSDQQALIIKYSQQTKIFYEVPTILEAAACIFMEYVRTGNRLYSVNPYTYTRCQEKDDDFQLAIGNFSPDGPSLYPLRNNSEHTGIGCLRKLPKDLKEAVSWYQKAAEQGDPVAQSALDESWSWYKEDSNFSNLPKKTPSVEKPASPAANIPDNTLTNVLDNILEASPPIPPAAAPVRFSSSSLSVTSLASVPPITPIRPNIPPMAFGKELWEKYLGNVGEEPPLPKDIDNIMKSSCPFFSWFFSNKRVEETHMLILIPKTVNGKPLTLNYLGDLVRYPKQGKATQCTYYEKNIAYVDDSHNMREAKSQSPQRSYWVLMTRDVIPGSRNKSYDDQVRLIKEFGQKAKVSYEVPNLLEAVTSILVEHLRTGKQLYSNNPMTYTRCHKESHIKGRFVVGGFAAGGLCVNCGDYYNLNADNQGIGALRIFYGL